MEARRQAISTASAMEARRRMPQRAATIPRMVPISTPKTKPGTGDALRPASEKLPRAKLAPADTLFPLMCDVKTWIRVRKPRTSTKPATHASRMASHAFSRSRLNWSNRAWSSAVTLKEDKPRRSTRNRGETVNLKKPRGSISKIQRSSKFQISGSIRQSAVVDQRVVVESNGAVLFVRLEDGCEFGEHRLVPRVARFRRVGGGHQPAKQALEIEHLPIREGAKCGSAGREESLDRGRIHVRVVHGGVIRGVGEQQVFVIFQKGRGEGPALVPNKGDPATRLENAHELAARAVGIKPMKRLAGSDEVCAVISERGGLRGAVDSAEIWTDGEQTFRRGAHFRVGFDSKNRIAVLEKKLGQNARARADVRNRCGGRESTLLLQQRDDFAWIARTILDVVLDSAGEALGGIGHGLCGSGSLGLYGSIGGKRSQYGRIDGFYGNGDMDMKVLIGVAGGRHQCGNRGFCSITVKLQCFGGFQADAIIGIF